MCLVAVAIGQSERFPLVLATNRDEYFHRPTAPLAWWQPSDGLAILAGRDLEAGGTWLGLNAAGRLALLTNIRRPATHRPRAPSRGDIVPLWLRGNLHEAAFFEQLAQADHNPFNLITACLATGTWRFASSDSPMPRELTPGIHGLSNATLDTPWPKIVKLKQAVRDSVAEASSLVALCDRLFAALADRTIAPDASLPSTGIALERERELSPAFILTPDHHYGTRCSTLVITERVDGGSATHMIERSFTPDGLYSTRTISTCAMPASSNSGPRCVNPART